MNTSALHVFHVLRLVSQSPVPLGVTEISRQIDLPPSTVHRALATLEQADYLARLEHASKYTLGPMPQFLARALFGRYPIRAAALPTLRRIAADAQETTSLAVRVGWYGMRVAAIEGQADIYHRHRVGETALLHAGPQARAILAFLGDEEIERYRRFVRVQHQEGAAETDKASFRKELLADRVRGMAVEIAVPGPGGCIALPVRDGSGRALAAIAIAGLSLAGEGALPATRLAAWLTARDELEARIAADPALAADPFGYLDPDAMRIAVRPA